MDRVELREMPSKEMLERFLAGMTGSVVEVTFNPIEGVFQDHVRPIDTDTSSE